MDLMRLFGKSSPPVIVTLDVDGVLLPNKAPEPHHYVYSPYGNGCLSEEAIQTVQSIAELLPIYYLTSWGDDANDVFHEWLGMRLKCIPLGGSHTDEKNLQKEQGLHDWLQVNKRTTRVLVLDDELTIHTNRVITIPINPEKGLVKEHLTLVKGYYYD